MDEKDLAPVQKGNENPQVVDGDIEFKMLLFRMMESVTF